MNVKGPTGQTQELKNVERGQIIILTILLWQQTLEAFEHEL